MPETRGAERIERWPIDRLRGYRKNSRTHSEEQVAKIAASIAEFGFTNPVLAKADGELIAGHGRVMAAKRLGIDTVPVIVLDYLTDAQRRAYIIADNQLATLAGWDEGILAEELRDLMGEGFDLNLVGFESAELDRLLAETSSEAGSSNAAADFVPEVEEQTVSVHGDVWNLGRHRVMCGDSTNRRDVERLMNGETALLLHADPPYGMGKEADGVENDNLYREKLDLFQMRWWDAFRPSVVSNGSAYIWGNAPDLWRLWYVGGLCDSEKLELRNEIVWDKKNIAGMASPDLTQFPTASERCLFVQFGNQFLSNINSEDFPDSWEPIRAYMEDEAIEADIKAADIKRVCGCGMYAHWFTRSQFTLIPEHHYRKLAQAYPGRFVRPWSELKRDWDSVKGSGRQVSYFDNAHDIMRDVWEFPRVSGDERHGHATPKPVAMMERIMKSSLPPGGLCAEPFGGSGATLIGAERTSRICYTMELQPRYVDVIVRRWEKFTGKKAVHADSKRTFSEMQAERT